MSKVQARELHAEQFDQEPKPLLKRRQRHNACDKSLHIDNEPIHQCDLHTPFSYFIETVCEICHNVMSYAAKL